MSFVVTQTIGLDGTGTEIPVLNIISSVQEYCLFGNVVATGNYALVPTGSPKDGSQIIIKYSGALNITTNTKTFSIFGLDIPQNILDTVFDAECLYWDGVWNVIVKPNITDYVISPSAIPDNSITTNKIVNANVTMAKLANNSVGTANIVDLNVTTGKLADNSVSTAKMATHSVDSTIIANNAVITNAIVDAAVTNAKLAAGPNNSIKVTGVSAVQDLTLLNNQVIGRLAGGLQAIPLSSLGGLDVVNYWGSFEANEQLATIPFLPYDCNIIKIVWQVVKTLSGTDDGTVTVRDTNSASVITTITVPASSAVGTTGNIVLSPYSFVASNGSDLSFLSLQTVKTTNGGKVFVTILVQRV